MLNSEQRFKMSKRVLMSLPGGVYMVSNTGKSFVEPCYEAEVATDLQERQAQWVDMKDAGAAACLYTIYDQRSAYLAWMNDVIASSPSIRASLENIHAPLIQL